MESAKLTPDSPDDAAIDAWLRANTPMTDLPEDGFSARVMAALPSASEPRRRYHVWLCIAGAMAGGALATESGSKWTRAGGELRTLGDEFGRALTPMLDPSLGIALLFATAALAFVYRRELQQRLVR